MLSTVLMQAYLRLAKVDVAAEECVEREHFTLEYAQSPSCPFSVVT